MTTKSDERTRRLGTALIILSALTTAIAESADVGRVNFNLGKSPVSDSPVQGVTLFGCNERINTDVFWDTDNQWVGNIPYGWRKTEGRDPYYASKYYIASPPVYRQGEPQDSKNQRPYIGLVTPNRFTFNGNQPAQIVYFDYRILQPTYLTFVPIDYDHKNEHGRSCNDLKVDSIPVNTQCSDFPWRNGALGAAGIGEISQNSKKVFLPLEGENKRPLNCSVSVLDDIQLDFDIHFVTANGSHAKTVSLTDFSKRKQPIKMVCYKRTEKNKPGGCRPPNP